jgi:hypothetical protein
MRTPDEVNTIAGFGESFDKATPVEKMRAKS